MTGAAAFNANGDTLHKLFRLPVGGNFRSANPFILSDPLLNPLTKSITSCFIVSSIFRDPTAA